MTYESYFLNTLQFSALVGIRSKRTSLVLRFTMLTIAPRSSLPMIVSPSQSPNLFFSAISTGRSYIPTRPRISPLPAFLSLRLFLFFSFMAKTLIECFATLFVGPDMSVD